MKKINFMIILLTLCLLTSCRAQNKHADSFYNINDGIDPRRIPLIKPIELNLLSSSGSWDLDLQPGIWLDYPNSQGLYYLYGHVHDVETIAVTDGIVMAYTSYLDEEADPYIQDNYYHWFVLIPDKEITKGFHTEEEFSEYIQSLDVKTLDWLIPDEVYKQFKKTGCLDWIPDCAQK
jgi:hypothetical protein